MTADTAAPNLLPCPFCGGRAKLVKSLPGCEYVKCSVCHADSDDTRGIEKWNTRATPTPTEARESIARIIDPQTFVSIEYYATLSEPYDEEKAFQAYPELKESQDQALAKADAILTLLPDAAAIRAAAFEEAAGVADCMADEYDATSFTSNNADQVAALRSKEQAAHEIAAALRDAGRK